MSTQPQTLDLVLDPEDNARLANLCGPLEQHLRQIERRLGIEISNRGLSFRLMDDDGILAAGHEVAFLQFEVPVAVPGPEADIDHLQPVEVTEGGGTQLVLRGNDFRVAFDRGSGQIVSYTYKGTDLLLEGPRPNFWRPPTDNDYGARLQERLRVWKDAGDFMRVQTMEVRHVTPQVVEVYFRSLLPEADSSAYELTYTVLGNGQVTIEGCLTPGPGDLPMLPRFGMRMNLPGSFRRLEWFGLGPQETYQDREAGARVGRFGGSVAAQFHPYVRPQETGNKTGVRWLALEDDGGTGLLVTGDTLLSASALHFLQEDLDEGPRKHQRHSGQLRPRNLVELNVDYRQMGVAGINSWGALPLPQYTLPYEPYTVRFSLTPYDASVRDPGELARIHLPRP